VLRYLIRNFIQALLTCADWRTARACGMDDLSQVLRQVVNPNIYLKSRYENPATPPVLRQIRPEIIQTRLEVLVQAEQDFYREKWQKE
jgi:hypothetical protein